MNFGSKNILVSSLQPGFINDTVLKNCPVCYQSKLKFLFKKSTNPLFVSKKSDLKLYKIFKCTDCGFVFVNPRPSKEQLNDFYKGQKVFFIGAGEEELKNYLCNKEKLKENYLPRIKMLEKFTSGRKLIEIGSAGGLFLDVAQTRGWDVLGVEPSVWGVKNSSKHLGVKTILGTVEDVKLPPSSFDVIAFYDVIEHLRNPEDAFRLSSRVLKNTGVIAITLPNADSIWAKLGKQQWSMYSLPEHLNYFSAKNLSIVLKRNGFEVIGTRTGSQPGFYAFKSLMSYFLKPYLNEVISGKTCGKSNNKQIISDASVTENESSIKSCINLLLNPIFDIANKLNLGEGLEIYARKVK